MCNMLGIPADTATGEGISTWGTMQAPRVVCAEIIFVKNKTLLYIVDYYRKFPVVKGADSLMAHDLAKTAKIVFVEFRLSNKIISDWGTNFT